MVGKPDAAKDGDAERLVRKVIMLRRAGVKAHEESGWVKATLAKATAQPVKRRTSKRR